MPSNQEIFQQYGLSDLAQDPFFIQWLDNSPAGGQIQQAMSGEMPEGYDPTDWLAQWGTQFQRVRDEGGSAPVTGGPNHDVGYWNSQGVSNDQIFDEGGQLRPGWTATATGYERVAAPNAPPELSEDDANPNPYQPPQGPGGIGGTGGGTAGGGFQFPTFTPPTPGQLPSYSYGPYQPGPPMQAPSPFAYPEFSYEAFSAPTMEQAANEPGYAFARDQGRKALENSAAARGTLRTGGTLKDLFAWGDQFAEQNYGNVARRSADIYGMNRGNAFGNWAANRENAADAYARNYGISRDVWGANTGLAQDAYTINRDTAQDVNDRAFRDVGYTDDRAFRDASAVFNPQFRAQELSLDDMYRRWRDQLNAWTSISTA